MNYRNVKMVKGRHFWVSFVGQTIIGDRLYAIIQNEQQRQGYRLNNKDKGEFEFHVQLKPGTYNVLFAYFTPRKCLDTWTTEMNIDGRIHNSHNLEVLLEGKAKDIPDARLMQLTKQLEEWEPLIHYSKIGAINIWEKSNSPCVDINDKIPLSFPLSSLESNEFYYDVDHEAAHLYSRSPKFLQPFLVQLIQESLKVSHYAALRHERNFHENSLIMLFKESKYVLDKKSGWSSGHPWDNVGELFASTTTILRNHPREFISNLQHSNNPALGRSIAEKVLNAYTSNTALPPNFFDKIVTDYFGRK